MRLLKAIFREPQGQGTQSLSSGGSWLVCATLPGQASPGGSASGSRAPQPSLLPCFLCCVTISLLTLWSWRNITGSSGC